MTASWRLAAQWLPAGKILYFFTVLLTGSSLIFLHQFFSLLSVFTGAVHLPPPCQLFLRYCLCASWWGSLSLTGFFPWTSRSAFCSLYVLGEKRSFLQARAEMYGLFQFLFSILPMHAVTAGCVFPLQSLLQSLE